MEPDRRGDPRGRSLPDLAGEAERSAESSWRSGFDILGKVVFEGRPLRELLIEAIRYGDQPEVRARLTRVVANAFDRTQLQELMEEHALAHDSMDASRVFRIREEMERAEARRLQPTTSSLFFLRLSRDSAARCVNAKPAVSRSLMSPRQCAIVNRLIGIGEPVLPRYERIVFEKALIAPQGQPLAAFVCPGHPLLDATLDLVIERHRDLLRRGTVLVDERDAGTEPRMLFYLEHAIQDASIARSGDRRVVSKRMLYVEMDGNGITRHLQYAPYLDYRPPRADEPDLATIIERPECAWIARELEQKAASYAIANVVPEHLQEVRSRKLELIAKTEAAVKERLTKEISYWDHRAEDLKHQEQAGKINARLNSNEARKRADNLQARLQKRMEELKLESKLSPLPPVILGGLLVVPAGLVSKMAPAVSMAPTAPAETQLSAARARQIIMEVERSLGFEPIDRETEKVGYDIESRIPGTGKLRFIEVKGRVLGRGNDHRNSQRNSLFLNKPEDFILAIVEFIGDDHRVHYVREPFRREPDFGVTSVNYGFPELLSRSTAPHLEKRDA